MKILAALSIFMIMSAQALMLTESERESIGAQLSEKLGTTANNIEVQEECEDLIPSNYAFECSAKLTTDGSATIDFLVLRTNQGLTVQD